MSFGSLVGSETGVCGNGLREVSVIQLELKLPFSPLLIAGEGWVREFFCLLAAKARGRRVHSSPAPQGRN